MADEVNGAVSSEARVPQKGAAADAILRVLAIITLVGVALQFLLAGAGAFGEGFSMHVTLGRALGWWTLVLLIAVLFARAGRRDIVIAIVLSVLAIVLQGVLAVLGRDTSAWFGALHVINGFAIGGLTSQLMAGASRRLKLRAQGG